MYTKAQLDILAFLDQYIAETPKEVIEKDAKAISAMKFAGVPASDYFDNFHQYFEGQGGEIQHEQILRIAVRSKQVLNMFRSQSEFGSMSKPYRLTVGVKATNFNAVKAVAVRKNTYPKAIKRLAFNTVS